MMTILIGLKAPAKGKDLYGDVDFWGADQQDPRPDYSPGRGDVPSGALWSSMTWPRISPCPWRAIRI